MNCVNVMINERINMYTLTSLSICIYFYTSLIYLLYKVILGTYLLHTISKKHLFYNFVNIF